MSAFDDSSLAPENPQAETDPQPEFDTPRYSTATLPRLRKYVGIARSICADLPKLVYWNALDLAYYDSELRWLSQYYRDSLTSDELQAVETASESCHREWLRRDWLCGDGGRKATVAGYVYLLSTAFKFFKIGCSTKPTNRLLTFAVQLPFEVDCVCTIRSDDMYGLESELHRQFADKRLRGEWFQLTPADVEYIKGLSDGG